MDWFPGPETKKKNTNVRTKDFATNGAQDECRRDTSILRMTLRPTRMTNNFAQRVLQYIPSVNQPTILLRQCSVFFPPLCRFRLNWARLTVSRGSFIRLPTLAIENVYKVQQKGFTINVIRNDGHKTTARVRFRLTFNHKLGYLSILPA